MNHLTDKQAVHAFARAQSTPGDWHAATQQLFATDAEIHVVHPFNTVGGVDGYETAFIAPLKAAFEGLHKRVDILIGGASGGSDWVAVHGHYAGKFASEWIGLKPSNRLEYLRFAEFFRMENGQAVEAHIFLDLPNLMITTDQWPIKSSPGKDRGYTGLLPGPATADGVILHEGSAGESQRSLEIIEAMLKSLATADEAWRPYWHANMLWHGPAAFGAFIGIEDFAGFQVPFEQAFSSWTGGLSGNGVTEHMTRYGDGDYACIAGWPSLMCVRRDMFLDQPASTDTVFMRVCDFWRRDGDKLVENWVLVDIPDVLLQMGCDLFEGAHSVAPGPRLAA